MLCFWFAVLVLNFYGNQGDASDVLWMFCSFDSISEEVFGVLLWYQASKDLIAFKGILMVFVLLKLCLTNPYRTKFTVTGVVFSTIYFGGFLLTRIRLFNPVCLIRLK